MKEKNNNIQAFKDSLLKVLGKNHETLLNVEEIRQDRFSTGNLKLDIELKGGYVKGTIIELYGYEKSGKSTSSAEAVREFQKKYPEEMVLWLDLEKAFDPTFFKKIGVDLNEDRFILSRPMSGEAAFDTVKTFCQSFEGGLIVIDSVSLLLPEKEDEQEMGNAQMGSQAKMMSQGLRKTFPHISKSNTTVIFINQLREKIGVMFGDNTTTSGGKSLAFYARTRIKISRVKGEYVDTSFGCNMYLEKATYGNEGVRINTHLRHEGGFDRVSDLMVLAIEAGIIEKSGSWFSYSGTKLCQGIVSLKEILQDNEEMTEDITNKLMENAGTGGH